MIGDKPDYIIQGVDFGGPGDPVLHIHYIEPHKQGRRAGTGSSTWCDKELVGEELEELMTTLKEILEIALVDARLNNSE